MHVSYIFLSILTAALLACAPSGVADARDASRLAVPSNSASSPEAAAPLQPAPALSDPNSGLPTAEQLSQDRLPRTATSPQALQPGNAPPLPNFNLPPDDWAKQELARRGFQRSTDRKLVALDPGHGGPEVGAAQGRLAEKTVNLQIALELKALLEAAGIQVLVIRETDSRVYALPEDQSLSPNNPLRADLQGRIDLANAAGADLFISIHNNGSANSAEAGTEVWYAPDRPFGEKNWLLAREVLNGLIGALADVGYGAPNRGLKNGSEFRVFRDRVFPLFVLGNPRTEPRTTRATQMPGILGESLFLSNPYEASLLAQEPIQLAIAKGYLRGVLSYFAVTG